MRPLQAVPTKAIIFILILALIGFADASYLTIEHYRNAIPPCTIGSCETVLTSAYSTVFGVPVALAGAIYYLIVLIAAFAYLEGKKGHHHEKALRFALILTIIAGLASITFISLMAFVLHTWCIYCLVSDTTSIILAITALCLFAKYRPVATLGA